MEAEALLPPGADVVDLGAFHGTAGHYLAARGHHVDSVEKNQAYIEDGHKIARTLGAVALGNRFIHGDMRTWEPQQAYDGALAIRSLQLVLKDESVEVIKKMKRIVTPGGLNVIKAYIASPEQQRVKSDRGLFDEEELQEIYSRSGWEIIRYKTTGIRPLSPWTDTEGNNGTSVSSSAELIAREVQRAGHRQTLLNQVDYYMRADPEYAELLREQAEAA
ncbi:MAG: class I SAM-dependent methyltransferase [Candidatus Saccharimonadales bacterium]